MAWITPKTDWEPADGIDNGDLNRVEGNIAFIATNPSGNLLQLAPDNGSVLIGTSTDDLSSKLQVLGHIKASRGFIGIGQVLGLLANRIIVDYSGDKGRVLAIGSDSGPKALTLNSGSGNVLVKTSTDDGVSSLKIDGITTASSGFLATGAVSDLSEARLIADFTSGQGRLLARGAANEQLPIQINSGGGNVLIGTSTDDTTNKLQLSGSFALTGAINPTTTPTLSSWALTTTPMIIPRGIYSIKHQGVGSLYSIIQMQLGSGTWVTISDGEDTFANGTEGDIIFSDGVNFRIFTSSGSVTVDYRKF